MQSYAIKCTCSVVLYEIILKCNSVQNKLDTQLNYISM